MDSEKFSTEDPESKAKITFSTNEFFRVNGQNVDSFNQLPPETQQKVRETLIKFQNNPVLSKFLGGKPGLTELMKQLNLDTQQTIIDQTPEKTADQALNAGNLSSEINKSQQFNQQYSRNNMYNASFNPAVKTDTWRIVVMVLALAGLGYYLLYTYVWHAAR